MKPIHDLYELLIDWIRTRIRSPISNRLSKGTFYTGAFIVATPLLEHLFFTAILKQAFGIDLGISVPDTNAYMAGSGLILLSLLHNITYIKLTQDFSTKQKAEKIALYQELWERVDSMIDDTARLVHLYCTHPKDTDKDYALKAENSIHSTLEYVRRNRLKLASQQIHDTITQLAQDCGSHTRSFRACIDMKTREDGSYDFAVAQKTINRELSVMVDYYNSLVPLIQNELPSQ
jgi:hypothetical protein